MNVFTQLTDSEGDAGEGGGGVDGTAEQRLDVVSLGGVLAPAQVRAGLQNRFCVQYTCTLIKGAAVNIKEADSTNVHSLLS